MMFVIRQFSIWRRTVILQIPIIACVLCQPASAQTFFENFDEDGRFLSDTMFSDTLISGGGIFERGSLTGVPGAPNATPALSINQGGDKELRYFELGPPAFSHSVALTGPYLLDSIIDAYLGFGVGSGVGARDAGLILRATSIGDYWVADIAANENLTGGARLRISPVHNGINSGFGPTFDIPDFDPASQAYHLRFQASGESLTAVLFRQAIENGVVTETFIGSVLASDSAPVEGRAGLYAFVRGDNSILFDDVAVIVPEPTTVALFSSAAVAMLLLRWRKRTHSRA